MILQNVRRVRTKLMVKNVRQCRTNLMPEENPSVGIVLCRDKDNTEVEFALRDISKPMGVATYRSRDELPQNYRYLPSSEDLMKLL